MASPAGRFAADKGKGRLTTSAGLLLLLALVDPAALSDLFCHLLAFVAGVGGTGSGGYRRCMSPIRYPLPDDARHRLQYVL